MKRSLMLLFIVLAFVSPDTRFFGIDISLVGFGLLTVYFLVSNRGKLISSRESSALMWLFFSLLIMYLYSIWFGFFQINWGRLLKLCFFLFSVPFWYSSLRKLKINYLVSLIKGVSNVLLFFLILGFLIDLWQPGFLTRVVFENSLDQNIYSGVFVKYIKFNEESRYAGLFSEPAHFGFTFGFLEAIKAILMRPSKSGIFWYVLKFSIAFLLTSSYVLVFFALIGALIWVWRLSKWQMFISFLVAFLFISFIGVQSRVDKILSLSDGSTFVRLVGSVSYPVKVSTTKYWFTGLGVGNESVFYERNFLELNLIAPDVHFIPSIAYLGGGFVSLSLLIIIIFYLFKMDVRIALTYCVFCLSFGGINSIYFIIITLLSLTIAHEIKEQKFEKSIIY